jgi:hypothetical protein
MMDDQPCQSRLRVPLDQHVLTGPDHSGPAAFLISAGEKLCLIGDSPNTLKLVNAASSENEGAKWMSAEFQVFDGIGSVFVIRHHFDRMLGYRSVIKTPGHQPQPSSVCPVRPNLGSLEHWPYVIEVIAFGNFTLLDADAPAECR